MQHTHSKTCWTRLSRLATYMRYSTRKHLPTNTHIQTVGPCCYNGRKLYNMRTLLRQQRALHCGPSLAVKGAAHLIHQRANKLFTETTNDNVVPNKAGQTMSSMLLCLRRHGHNKHSITPWYTIQQPPLTLLTEVNAKL